jgi:SAM-dependent methyltransferase
MTVSITPAGLDGAQRTQLERLVISARSLLEDDLGAQLVGRFGIHADGTVEDEHDLPDDPTDRANRRDLVEITDHLCSLGETSAGAVARLLREAAFTHLNRLLAIRIAEAIGLLPESLGDGRQSRGFKDLGEILPILADDYWGYLQLCGDELAADAPTLFDPRNPLLALRPSTSALDELLVLLGDREAADIWIAPDALGWAYQFFNTAGERRKMRDDATAPRNSRELAVLNQFFTPRYVVDFLVQNTLGRRLIESDPTSPLLDDLPLLVAPHTEPGPPLDLSSAAVLDPACGSGHFLLGCYDLLERAWELRGVPASEAAPAIVASLWGVDIDPRCAQVASAAIVLRARRHCRELSLPKPNIVTARRLPGNVAALSDELGLTPERQRVVDRIDGVLADAPVLGVLLRAEEMLEREIRHAAFGGASGTLPLTDDAFDRVDADLMAQLQDIADRASSSVADRLLAAEADDALRLVEIVRQRYDAVLMNPPFGEPVPDTKPYLRAAYPWLPGGADISAAFVGRGLELCKPTGYLGAITSRAGLFITTFQNWRRTVLLGNRLTVLADLGYRVMQQAKVEAAAYVIGPGQPLPTHEAVCIRILKERDRAQALAEAIAASRAAKHDRRVFHVPIVDFELVPGSPLAYWLSAAVRRLFTDLPRLEGNGAEARQGLATADDFRFVRAFWEVDPRRIAHSVAESREDKRWAPFAKGGEYGPFWADIHLIVDWQNDGERIRAFDGARPQNIRYFFRPGLTWPRRTNSAMAVRILPAGCVFADKGPALVTDEPLLHLAWLNSRVVRMLIDATAASADEDKTDVSRSYEVGIIQSLPSPVPLGVDPIAPRAAGEIAAAIAARDATSETTRRFVAPAIPARSTILDEVRSRSAERWQQAAAALEKYAGLDRAVTAVVDPDDRIEEALADASGPVLAELSGEELTPAEGDEIVRLLGGPMADVVEAATAKHGVARWIGLQHQIVDRRLELAAIAVGHAPRVVATHAANRGVFPAEELGRVTRDLLSYLVGCAFGRWDVRVGRDPAGTASSPDLFAPVPACPPGMLVGPDGFPDVGAPTGYPLELPPGRLLVDEVGHRWDIEAGVLAAANALVPDRAAIVAEMLEILGRRTVRDYLRKQFFREHLSRYSKSRRKAPVYWPLSVPSKNWGVWLYAPTLSRETLYAVASQAERRQRLALETVARLQREQSEASSGRPARRIAEELDAEEKLVEELRLFRAETERVAALGWEPDPDDGMLLCAAPLANVFPAWTDAKKARDELRKGHHDWTTVSHWASRL